MNLESLRNKKKKVCASVKNVDIYGCYFPGVNSVKLLYLESSVYVDYMAY